MGYCWGMTTNKNTASGIESLDGMQCGQRVAVRNKYDNDIADGIVTSTARGWIQIKDIHSEELLSITSRSVNTVSNAVIRLKVAS